MHKQYRLSRPTTRAEACQIISGFVIRRRGDFFFRTDDVGVWVSCWRKGVAEVVITYLAPDFLDPEIDEHILALVGVANF